MSNLFSPVETLMHVSAAYVVSRCLHVVAELGVADALDDVAQTPDALSASVGANPDALSRTLRLLATNGIFELHDGLVGHTPASSLLRSDHPHSMRPLVRMLGMDLYWRSFESLQKSARSGIPVNDDSAGSGFWSYLDRDPEASQLFNAAMTAKAHAQIAGVLGAYDFSPFNSIADIGGGQGHLLEAILEATPASRGVLFDLPHVTKQVSKSKKGSERMTMHAGDFFTDDLPTCDCYVIMDVLQDWSDADVLRILKSVRCAIPAAGRLLVIATMLPEPARSSWGNELDIYMLVVLGGRLRTLAQYTDLFRISGFDFERAIDIGGDTTMLEVRPVSERGAPMADELSRRSAPASRTEA